MKSRGPAIFLLALLIIIMTGPQYSGGNVLPAYAESGTQPPAVSEPAAGTEPLTGQTSGTANETVPTAPPKVQKLKFAAVGDIMPGRKVGRILEAGGGYSSAFSNVAAELKWGDVVFANLESPLTASTHGLNKAKKIVLKASPDAVEALLTGGFNLVSLSNNHMLDYYDTGLYDTISILDKSGIAHAGAGKDAIEAGKPAIIEKNGYKIGLLAYTDMAEYIYDGDPMISFAAGENKAGVIPRDYDVIKQAIMELRKSVDILAVSLHWGVEESFTIPPEQVEFARKLMDDGVDLILGHHPHQFQGIEIYKGKPIIYSMGNFLFDQNDPENNETFIVQMEYEEKTLKSFSLKPVRIIDKSLAELQYGENARGFLEREAGLCEKLGTTPIIEGDSLVFNISSQ